MDVVLSGAAVCQTMYQPWVRMKVEDHWFVRSKESFELAVGYAVRMLGMWYQPEQVHYVDEPDLHVRQVLPEQSRCGQTLHGRQVAAARHHHVGFGTLVVAGPGPDASALRAVRDRRVHV